MLGYFTEFTNISNLIDQTLLEGTQPTNVLSHGYGDPWLSPTNDAKVTFRKKAEEADDSTKDPDLF